MGESSFVNKKSMAAPAARPRRVERAGIDWPLLAVTIALTLFGLLMIYSASPKFVQLTVEGEADGSYYMVRQSGWLFVSLIAMFVASRFPYRLFQRFTVLMMGVTIVLLIVVAALQDTTFGSNRSVLGGSIRPSELAKLVILIYVSVWLNAKREVLNDIFLGLFPLIAILGITAGLILLQPDISAAITIVVLGGVMFFLAGGAWRQIGITIATAILFGWIVVNVFPTGITRITTYLTGLNNPLQAHYHVQRSLEAIVSGGFFGVGIGHGSTKFTGLPVPTTDSIFAVITEEMGLLGAGLVILGYIFLLWRGLAIANRAPDKLGSLLASGITVWIVIEAMLNMAVMVNLLPQAGNALPLISYGGSSLLITMVAIGILMNIAQTKGESKSKQGGGTFGAVVDMRWRDRRRGVSRSGNLSGPRQRS